jgi:hypothetical protein
VPFDPAAVWNLLSGMAIAATLWGIAGTIFSVAMSRRLHADRRVIEAAERLEAVSLTTVVKRYVPPEQQTQKAAEEMAIAKRVIEFRQPRWRRAAIISAVLMLCGAGATAFAVQRDLSVPPTAKVAAKPAPTLDALEAVSGVWGWRADALQSCEENPQKIALSRDAKTLSIRYAKPLQLASGAVTELNYEVVSVEQNMLVLAKEGSPQGSARRIFFRFIDRNAFAISWSNDPNGSSGTIARCGLVP